VKITGGQWKGRKIKVPRGTRPTTARSKEVLFTLINDNLPDSVVIDLFCGSGALGLEALSRGARHVYFIDRSQRAIHTVRENIEWMDVEDMCTVIAGDAFRTLRKLASHGRQADLILADPPYESGLCNKIALIIAESKILNPGGLLVVEFRKGEKLDNRDELVLKKSRLIGETGLAFWERL
jgi:16S rRNA (guanine966-N2)-methyltransferase